MTSGSSVAKALKMRKGDALAAVDELLRRGLLVNQGTPTRARLYAPSAVPVLTPVRGS